MLTLKDKGQIALHGVTEQKVVSQLEGFKHGFKPLPVASAATVGDGIIRVSQQECENLVKSFDNATLNNIVKFVPASGAATRMFKDLFEYVNDNKPSAVIDKLLDNLPKFAFYSELTKCVSPTDAPHKIVGAIINDGLNYGAKPKGQILFHSYPDGNRTAVEEHLVEGAMYASAKGCVNIHFTVSAEHQEGFEMLINASKAKYEAKYNVKYNISYSQQKSSTDTIAVNLNNTPFRNADDSLLFRPAGHGALIENLNAIDADVIFVKNIDNITTDRLKADTVTYKKVIAAIMLQRQAKTFEYLHKMDAQITDGLLSEIAEFVQKELCFKLPDSFTGFTSKERSEYLRDVLNRPIRVCGMVRNDGEPGGGPFWVTGSDGAQSLQIAEQSQISAEKSFLLKEGTHFNPVDLVCGVKTYNGGKFDLAKYVDHSTCFICEKSKDGKALKALELPGLWNGAMANWNTIFVETPLSTFTPVKVITDLLRDQHQ